MLKAGLNSGLKFLVGRHYSLCVDRQSLLVVSAWRQLMIRWHIETTIDHDTGQLGLVLMTAA